MALDKISYALVGFIALGGGCASIHDWATRPLLFGQTSQYANEVACFGEHYFGSFGDDRREWEGQFFVKENLTMIRHVPTHSEFFMCVNTMPDESDVTNSLRTVVSKMRKMAEGIDYSEDWTTFHQELTLESGARIWTNLLYLHGSFTGRRVDTEYYSMHDKVMTDVYATCFTAIRRGGRRPICFFVGSMVPVNVSASDRNRLTGVMKHFLDSKLFLREGL